jgi:peptidoglycan/LPS O-acetylase OafA/YrhL
MISPVFRIALYYALSADGSRVANYVMLPARMDALFLGSFGAWMMTSDYEISKKHLYTASILLGLAYCTVSNARLGFDSFLLISAGYSIIALFYFSLLLIAVQFQSSTVARIFRNRILIFYGILAYGIYLLHQPILGLTHAFVRGSSPTISSRSAYLITAFAFGLLSVVCYYSWHYFEKPFVKLGHRLKYHKA